MEKRYVDVLAETKSSEDFVIRRRAPSLPQLFYMCCMVLAVSLFLSYQVYDRLALASLLFMLLGSISWYVTVQVQRNRDLAEATEFQNALIASALGMHHKFCIITKLDGTIFYFDRSFQNMFPDFARQNERGFKAFLEHGNVTPSDGEKMLGLLKQGTYAKAVFDIRSDDGIPHKIDLSIEPIPRPRGFLLLRGVGV